MLKNVFAIIGVVVVARFMYRGFDKHVRVPLERTITDALTDEKKQTA